MRGSSPERYYSLSASHALVHLRKVHIATPSTPLLHLLHLLHLYHYNPWQQTPGDAIPHLHHMR
jgi:hypothetical protein